MTNIGKDNARVEDDLSYISKRIENMGWAHIQKGAAVTASLGGGKYLGS